VLPLAEKTFGQLPAKKTPPRVWANLPPQLGDIHVHLKHADVQQAVWQSHYIVPPATPQTILQSDATMVLADILGNGRIGLLNQILVKELNLASSAEAYYDASSIGPTNFSVVVVPQNGVSQNQINAAIDDVLKQQLTIAINATSVKESTQRLNLAAIFARDSLDGPAMQVGQALAQGLDLKTIEAWPARMQNVLVKDVQKAAKQLLAASKLTIFAESETK
jgi:zinc protease